MVNDAEYAALTLRYLVATSTSGRVECFLKALGDASAAAGVQGAKGQTALSLACSAGQLGVVRSLCETQPSLIHVNDKDNCSPFFFACYEGHLEVARFLLSRDASLIHVKTNSNRSPLWAACRQGHLEVARFLLSCDASLIHVKTNIKSKLTARGQGCKDRHGNRSPLYVACFQGHLEVVRYLVSLDVLTEEERAEGLAEAREKGHTDVVALLESIVTS